MKDDSDVNPIMETSCSNQINHFLKFVNVPRILILFLKDQRIIQKNHFDFIS